MRPPPATPTTPPSHDPPSHDAPVVSFIQVKWSQEGDGEAQLPAATFSVDISALGSPCTPMLLYNYKDSNHQQGTLLLGGPPGSAPVLTLKEYGPWQTSPAPFEATFAIQGVCYPQGDENNDLGVLLSAWIYPDGVEIEMQWMDVGPTDPMGPPDWGYHNNQSYIWIPTNGSNFNVLRVPQTLTLKLVKS
jgi:hypothetical protein